MQHIDFNEQLKQIQDILKLPKEMRWMKDGFTIVPNSILTADIPKELKMLYIILLMFAFKKKQCFPSIKLLCSTLGVSSERGVQKNINRLKELGWIKIEYRTGKPSVYTLTKS